MLARTHGDCISFSSLAFPILSGFQMFHEGFSVLHISPAPIAWGTHRICPFRGKKIQGNGIHITTSEYPCYALHLCVTYGSGFLWLPVHDLIGISARRDGIGIECYAHMQNAILKRM